MPIFIVQVPPPIKLVSPDGHEGTVLTFTEFVKTHVLEHPDTRGSLTLIRQALGIERSLNALAAVDLGGAWEIAGEDKDFLTALMNDPKHIGAVAVGDRIVHQTLPGFGLFPWAARQYAPFMIAIADATLKE